MKKPSHECRHKFKTISRDVERCVKCKTEQLIIVLSVEGTPKAPKPKKVLGPNKEMSMYYG